MELGKDEAESVSLLGPDTSLNAFHEETLQTSMLEGPDHMSSVTRTVTLGKTSNGPAQRRAACGASAARACWASHRRFCITVASSGSSNHGAQNPVRRQ